MQIRFTCRACGKQDRQTFEDEGLCIAECGYCGNDYLDFNQEDFEKALELVPQATHWFTAYGVKETKRDG